MGIKQASLRRFVLTAGLTAFALMVLCMSYLFYPAIRARYLFSQMETLQLGHSDFDDAQRVARRIGATANGPCDRSLCEWAARRDNVELPRWWRGSGAAFVVAFDVKDSVVVRKNTGYGIGKKAAFNPSSVALLEQEHWGRSRIPEPLAAGWRSSDWYRYLEFTVYITPKASAADRQRYTASITGACGDTGDVRMLESCSQSQIPSQLIRNELDTQQLHFGRLSLAFPQTGFRQSRPASTPRRRRKDDFARVCTFSRNYSQPPNALSKRQIIRYMQHWESQTATAALLL